MKKALSLLIAILLIASMALTLGCKKPEEPTPTPATTEPAAPAPAAPENAPAAPAGK